MKIIKFLSIVVILTLFIVFPSAVFADNVITVGKSKQYENLTDALNNAVQNDTILIYPGQYFIPYNEVEKSFITINKDGLTIKGVDKNGNDIISSDYSEVIISPARYNGTVQAQGLIYVKAHNIKIEGIHITNYIKGMPAIKWAGIGVSSGSSNKVIFENKQETYPETKYEKVEDISGKMPEPEHKAIYDLANISILDIKDKTVKIIDLSEIDKTLENIIIKSDNKDENSFIFSTIQLDDNDLNSKDTVFCLETEYGNYEIPYNIMKLINNYYQNNEEYDTSIQANYGDKLNIKFTIKDVTQINSSILGNGVIKGQLAAPIVKYETIIQSKMPISSIYNFKNNLKKQIPLFENIDTTKLKVYFMETSDSFKEIDYNLIEKNNKVYAEINNNKNGTIIITY